MKRKSKTKSKITISDYLKAVKKADRDIQLTQSDGWARITKVHKSKKVYDRKRAKGDLSE